MKSTENIQRKGRYGHHYLLKLKTDTYNSKFSFYYHKIRPKTNKLNEHGTFVRDKKRAKLNALVNILFHTKSCQDKLFLLKTFNMFQNYIQFSKTIFDLH